MSRDRFSNWEPPVLVHAVPTKWLWVVWRPEGLTLGRFTDIGAFTLIQAEAGVIIEEDVQIGSHCAIYSVSTIDDKRGKVVLKKGCCIGSHSTVMPGVTVGEGTIVGAHSLVTRDLPDHVVAVGCPARVVRHLSPDNL